MKGILSNIILVLAFGIIGILAVPALLIIGVISLIWSAADRIIRWIDN